MAIKIRRNRQAAVEAVRGIRGDQGGVRRHGSDNRQAARHVRPGR
jgi:hypothetical protein